ncbi:MAG: Inosine-5'-monophosphate dehydrogenase [Parcubacteria group bacterium GW2011_GWA2_42_18]|nr:MAG: Inosine-5'-monophosphate dehydrogenase [Parcubacteria group bacterium GW2011_GWA2_42_18]
MKRIIKEEGLTFDDVLLIPAYSNVLPRNVNTSTFLTRKIRIPIPVISAAMDTVTEEDMAIALARQGGFGIIHKNMSLDVQVIKVRKVKRAQSGIIIKPFTLPVTACVKDAFKLMKDKNIGGIPILDENEILVGIVTSRDLNFCDPSDKRSVESIMTSKVITARKNASVQTIKTKMLNSGVEKIPIISAEGKLLGMYTAKDLRESETSHRSCKDDKGRLRVGAAVGVTPDVLERVTELVGAGVDVVCLDTAHGHSKGVLDTIKKIKRYFPDLQLMAGNVATEKGAEALIKAGADAVKVGVGPGSICTTRIIAGIGVPQLTAIMEVAKACKKAGIPLVADGGIRYAGDITKALAAGASTVMIGSLFSGTDESPGESIILNGQKFKVYRGMGSAEAMYFGGSKDRYFQDTEDDLKKLIPEGVTGRVPYRGTIAEVVHQLVGGLRAGMGYCGARVIKDLWKARFIQITPAGVRESHPHDITITKESPNYSPL